MIDASSAVRLQPTKPTSYRLPPVVQPVWRWRDLVLGNATESLDILRTELCRRYDARYCLLLDRARSGLYLLCKSFGLNREWIVTTLMHRPSCVVLQNQCAGLAFADVDQHMTIDAASVDRVANASTCAILATHTYGKAADVAALRASADARGLFLVENAVHMASGQRVRDRRIGAWGDATLLSFNVDKPLGGILGGALLTNREDVWRAVSTGSLGPANADEMRERIRTTYLAYRLKPMVLRLPLGRQHRAASDGVAEITKFPADTYRTYTPRTIHPLQSKVALANLRREEDLVARRRDNAERLHRALQDVDWLRLPESTEQQPHTYTYFPVIVTKGSRFALGEHLSNRGIETKWRLPPLHLQPGFDRSRCDNLDRSVQLWEQHLLLPAGCCTRSDQIDLLATAVKEFVP